MVLICVSLRVRDWNLNYDFISWLGRRTIIDWSLFRLFLLIEKRSGDFRTFSAIMLNLEVLI